jgi:hypothetical protein
VSEPERTWIVLPFRGEFLEKKIAPIFQEALFKSRPDLLSELVVGHAFAGERLRTDAEARLTRLTNEISGGNIDYLGEGPYPAHWRMDAVRGVFHYAGTSAWCFEAYRLMLDLAVIDPPPPGWSPAFPEAAPGGLDSGGSLWDFFGDLSNEGYEFDSYMAKLFDSMPVWISPPESTFTGFLNEKDVVKMRGMIEALGEGRRTRSFYLREFHAYLTRAIEHKVGLTAAAVPAGKAWQEEAPLTDDKKWLKR